MSAATHLSDDLQRIVEGPRSDVRWVDGNRRAPVLRASPIDVGAPLAHVWQDVTAVLTSATIPPRLRERVGLPGDRSDEIDVGSPFDYRNHALLYVARHLPDRRRPEAEPAIHRELAELITAAGGRTLALFTSHRADGRRPHERCASTSTCGCGSRGTCPRRGFSRRLPGTRRPASLPPWAFGRASTFLDPR